MRIEAATVAEADAVAALVRLTIDTVYPKYYSPEIVTFFKELHDFRSIMSDIIAGKCLILREGSAVVGTVTADGVHVRRLFVLPARHGCGFGSALLRAVEERIAAGHAYAELDASLASEKFYEQAGYVCTGEQCERVGDALLRWRVYRKRLGKEGDGVL